MPPGLGASIVRAIRRGQLVVDRVFDEVFEPQIRRQSSVHWTPVEVAMRAAKLLAPEPNATILDVGSGVGKFCIVAAAALRRARVRGVEQRAHFVEAARQAARTIGVSVEFDHGTVEGQDPSSVDGVYLFNPFAENLCTKEDHLDDTVELSEARYWRDIRVMEDFLRAARAGTRVVTYCGFGGSMPTSYRIVQRDRCAGTLELWAKSEVEHGGPAHGAPDRLRAATKPKRT